MIAFKIFAAHPPYVEVHATQIYFIDAPDLETALVVFKATRPGLRVLSVESWGHSNNHTNSQYKKVFEDESQTP